LLARGEATDFEETERCLERVLTRNPSQAEARGLLERLNRARQQGGGE